MTLKNHQKAVIIGLLIGSLFIIALPGSKLVEIFRIILGSIILINSLFGLLNNMSTSTKRQVIDYIVAITLGVFALIDRFTFVDYVLILTYLGLQGIQIFYQRHLHGTFAYFLKYGLLNCVCVVLLLMTLVKGINIIKYTIIAITFIYAIWYFYKRKERI